MTQSPGNPFVEVSTQSAARRVHVWTVATAAREVQQRLEGYRTLLSADEARRVHRFVQSDDAMRFVIGRALARTMLSRFADVAPRDWSIMIDEHGRPHVAERRPGTPDLRFNVTHTDGLVACAIAIGREVGVDVERINRHLAHDVADRFFSAQEVADLRALPGADQPTIFFDYWTLKEAYIKARGLGLMLPLHQFAFLRTPGSAPCISFAPELRDDPASWQFAQFWPTPEHRMAVAVRRTGDDLPILVEPVVPEVPA